MEKEIFTVLSVMILSSLFISGCLVENPIDEKPEPTEKPMIIYVNDDFDDTMIGWGINNFNSIQDGINNIKKSGNIYVYNGIYNENIIVNQSINLVGENKYYTIIESIKNDDILEIIADNCIIQNITIKNSSFNTGIRIKSNNNTLKNNIITGNLYGLWIEGKSENIISNNIISKNKDGITLKNSINTIINDNEIFTNIENGIVIDSTKNVTIIDNKFEKSGIKITGNLSDSNTHIIEDNTENEKPLLYYKDRKGVTIPSDAVQVILVNCSNFKINNINFQNMTIPIQIFYCSNISIDSNYFSTNIQNAIISYFSENNIINGNIINSGKGFYIYNSSNNRITQNKLENTSTAIELLYSNNNFISNNNILSSSDYGIFFQYNSNNNTIILNNIENSSIAIELYNKANNNNISNNNIFNNDDYGILFEFNSDYNIISRNKINSNQCGVRLKSSSKSNEVFNNEFNKNYEIGIYVCCGTEENIIYNNSFIKNLEHVKYSIQLENYFYMNGFGNYWDDYLEKYSNATQINGIWSIPYKIDNTDFEDKYPLVNPVNI